MHGNLRYVKSALIGLIAALALASPAQAQATSPVAKDGSFQAAGLGSSEESFYRAVYVDSATTVPFGFLPGVPVGAAA